jgi:hypothetical protein
MSASGRDESVATVPSASGIFRPEADIRQRKLVSTRLLDNMLTCGYDGC